MPSQQESLLRTGGALCPIPSVSAVRAVSPLPAISCVAVLPAVCTKSSNAVRPGTGAAELGNNPKL